MILVTTTEELDLLTDNYLMIYVLIICHFMTK